MILINSSLSGQYVLYSMFYAMQSFAQSFARQKDSGAIDIHDSSVDVCIELAY